MKFIIQFVQIPLHNIMKESRAFLRFTTLLSLFFLCILLRATNVPPNFITTISGSFEVGTAVLTSSSSSPSGSFSSQSTTVTYLNTYSTTPQFGFGFGYINSAWPTTTSTLETIIDITIVSSSTGYQILQLNYTSSTVNILSINYIACVSGFFMDVRTALLNTSALTVASSSLNTVRSTTINIPYKSKSNSSNSVAVYTTIGISMVRAKNTFEYSLTTNGFATSSITVTLTVQPFNGVKFLRFSVFNYQSIVVTVDSPYFLDMGFGTALGGTIPDSSNLGLTTLGTIFTGMTDWAISDTFATIAYNMSLSGRVYNLDSSTATRTQTAYLWYRQAVCPTYYFNRTNLCVPCHYSCLTCFQQSSTSCSTCDGANSFRYFSSSNFSCPCLANYKDTSVSICQAILCPGYCTTCSDDNVCTVCNSIQYRKLSNGTCICIDYTIDMWDYGSSTCSACFPTCLTCSQFASQTACLTCSLSRDHRTFISSNSTCICVSGYYEILNLANPASANPYLYKGAPCLACHYSCATCTNNTICLTCNSSINRAYSSSTKLCYCQPGFYDNFLQQTCLACPYNCLTCTSAAVCLTCPTTRQIKTNNCTCTAGFFESGVSQCTACNISCQTCSNANSCTSCSISNFRTMSGTTCICTTGYYDIFVVQPCEPCDATCKTCNGGASNNCQSCDNTKNRELTSNKTCVCMTGFYQEVDNTCTPCNYKCLTCANSVQCLTCSGTNHRIISGTTCACANKYYDDTGNQLCKSCMYFCLTCTSSTTCTTCDSATRITTDLTKCLCQTGFYDDGVSSSCQSCLPSCLTCTNPNNCTTCPSNRGITTLGSCLCNARTFQPYCNACYYSCLSCSGTSTTCTSCNGTALRYLDSATSKCLCYQSFYDDTSNQLCLSCHYSCLTCTSYSSCTSCPVNRVANGSYCSCISTFYQNSQNLNCLACHYTCLTCSDFSTCTTCSSANNRISSANTSLCICSTGYYDNSISQTCFSCHPICETCSVYSTCLSCNSTQNFYFSNNTCLCVKGYYFDSATNTCIACDYSCDSCISGTACLTCKNNRTQTSTFCACLPGLFDDFSAKACTSCTYPCITCVTTSNTCTSCDQIKRTLSSNTCVCPQKTYDIGLNCTACHSSCQTCTNGSSCITCLTGSGRILDSSGICVCPTGFHDENGTSLICAACNHTCATCINSVSCSTCYTGRTATIGGHCICPTLYFYDNLVNPPCVACFYSCLSCSTISTNCLTCDASTNRAITNNTCQCSKGYFDNYITATCQACHYSCATCSASNACLTCDSSSKRIYLTGPTCSCMSSFYDISNVQLCDACDFTCLTCISQPARCVTCPSTRTLQSASNSCPCNTGLYNIGNATCVSCLISCLTCDNGATCLSCPSTRKLNSLMLCICSTGYYDVAGISQCSACSPLCFQCSSYSVCTLCDTNNNHRQLVNTSCQCPTGYYDASASANYTCQLCPRSCATCVSGSQCSSCNINYQRTYSLATKLCICSTGFYDDNINSACQPCPVDCQTCSNNSMCLTCPTDRYLDSTTRCSCLNSTYLNGTLCQSCPIECLSCSSSSVCTSCVGIRVLVNNACVCPAGQYSIVGTSSCSGCHYSCTTCVSSAQCSTCNSTMNRYLTSTLCLCSIGYYDGGAQDCKSCHYSCYMCLSSTSCQACNILINRIYNSNTTLCSCVSGFYQDNSTKTCIQCHYSCLTCSSSIDCTSCNSNVNRILNTNSSQCSCNSIGYFDTFISPICSACDYTCLSCSGSSTFCTSCLNSTFRSLSVSKCTCFLGYFDVVNQPICLSCSYKCVSCQGTADNCTICSTSNFRQLIPVCSCIAGYYDTGNQSLCATCSYECQTCTNGLTCTTCNLTISHRSLNSVTSVCDCIPQYYSVGRAICQKCAYSCQTCSQASSCLTCPTTRSLTQGQCICLQKYYDDYTNLQCLPCHYTCQTCMNSSSCFSCSSTNKRTFNSSTYLCSCVVGYFDVSVESCTKCDASCYTCNDGVSCSSCPPNINKTLNATVSNFCVCLYGYYENTTAGAALGYSSVCNPCYFACSTCTGLSTTCTYCTPTSNRYLTSSKQCSCNTGYFQIYGQLNCLACYTNCLSCFGVSASSCLSCDNTTYYLNNSCYAACPSFYNISLSTRTCASCPNNCLSCPTSLTICSSCNSPYFIFASNSSYSSCVDNCPANYYQVNRSCSACISPCVTCTSAYACLTCVSKYYLIGTFCNPCHTLCQTCSGSTALDCLTCISDYVLRGGVCQKLNCLSTQYVQSSIGCVNCSTTFPNSLSCLSTGPTACQQAYILSNSSCKICSAVSGYIFSSTSGKCEDYCGDGIAITDLCDDGNNLNGDGCSSWCTIESGWNCVNSACTLLATPTLTLVSVSNNPKNHVITILFSLSVGVRLVNKNFILTFSEITQFSYEVYPMNIYYTAYRLQIAYKQTAANNNLYIQVKSPISRLLATSTQLSISLSLNINVPIVTNPPAIYISESQSKIYTTYLFGLMSTLQALLLLAIAVFLAMKLKIMLLVIDALNSIRIVYILTGLGLYNITLLSHQSSRGLQPFIYQFGSDLLDTTSNFYYFNYTSNFFSSTIIQYFLIITAFLLSFFFNKTNPGDQNIWSYYKTSFIFAFSYDIALASFSIFFWNGYKSYQSSYSWTFAILGLIYLVGEAIAYYSKMKNVGAQKKKVVPAVSFITNQLEIRDKTNQDINIFEFYEDSGKEKKISKPGTSEVSDQNTEILGGAEGQPSQTEEITKYYDLTPSQQSHYSSKSGHITSSFLPICSILFSILFSLISNIQEIVARSAIFLVLSFSYLFFIIFLKNQSLKSLRNIKLIVFSLIYIILSIFGLALGINYRTADLISMDKVIVSFVFAIVLFNIITFIVSVCKSEAFKEYLVNKKNEQILQRIRKQNEARQKIYTKNEFNKTKKDTRSKIDIDPSRDEIRFQKQSNQIQVSEEQVQQQKNLKISNLKKRAPRDDRTMLQIRDKDSSSIIRQQIDQQISDARYSDFGHHNNSNLLNEKNVFDLKKSAINDEPSGIRKIQGSRVRAINSSELSLGSKKGETPSLFFDQSLQRIDEYKGVKRNINKSNQKEEMGQKKKIKRKKKANADAEVISGDEIEKKEILEIDRYHPHQNEYRKRQNSEEIVDMLEELDMPRGFKMEQNDSNFRARILSIDQISSIKQERDQFIEQQQSQYDGSVFNKILQDYRKYRHKKVDKKKLKQFKDKKNDRN